jgi:hypothetical protein
MSQESMHKIHCILKEARNNPRVKAFGDLFMDIHTDTINNELLSVSK